MDVSLDLRLEPDDAFFERHDVFDPD